MLPIWQRVRVGEVYIGVVSLRLVPNGFKEVFLLCGLANLSSVCSLRISVNCRWLPAMYLWLSPRPKLFSEGPPTYVWSLACDVTPLLPLSLEVRKGIILVEGATCLGDFLSMSGVKDRDLTWDSSFVAICTGWKRFRKSLASLNWCVFHSSYSWRAFRSSLSWSTRSVKFFTFKAVSAELSTKIALVRLMLSIPFYLSLSNDSILISS